MATDLQQIYQRALVAHENGDYTLAVELYDTILSAHPDADLVLYNQGLALYQLREFPGAVSAFTRIITIEKADADTWFNLGLALKGCGLLDKACQAYEEALELAPDEDILFNLANCLREIGRTDDAALYYEALLKSNPDHISAINNFAFLCHKQGDNKQAHALYSRLLALEPDHPGAAHMLAALEGTSDTAPSPEYISELFDQYSADFEQSLVNNLCYRVPELLFAMLTQHFPERYFATTLDLGCGTGLAGVLFRQLTKQLSGVDLSTRMVQHAAEKQCYDQLEVADVLQFLAQYKTGVELFVAADLLMYLADLQPLFTAVKNGAVSGGLFVFSTEFLEHGRWQIRSTGRFAHNPEYISTLVQQVGGRVLAVGKERIRKEAENWLMGNIFLIALDG